MTVTLLCLALLTFVGVRNDIGPFIYLHAAPPKLTQVIESEFSQVFAAYQISSVTFGRTNDLVSDNVDVEVFAGRTYTFKIPNPKLGKVRVLRNSKTNELRVFCQIPEDQPFNHYASSVIVNTKVITQNVARLKSIKATYE